MENHGFATAHWGLHRLVTRFLVDKCRGHMSDPQGLYKRDLNSSDKRGL